MVEYKQGKEIINTFNHIDEILFYLYDNEKKDYEEKVNDLYDTQTTHIFKNLFILKNKEKLQNLVNHYNDYDDRLLIKISDCKCWGVSGNYDFFDLEELDYNFESKEDLNKYRSNKEYAEKKPYQFIAITIKQILKGLYK